MDAKMTHKQLTAAALLLGKDYFYDWRDGTFTYSPMENAMRLSYFDPYTMEEVSAEEASKRRLGKVDGWRQSTPDHDFDHPQWETPIGRMDDAE